jgi:putative addiction module component (TIGR02574 family)
MTAAVQSLKDQLLRLSPDDRTELAKFLIDSLRDDCVFDVDPDWVAELDGRRSELENGIDPGEPAESVFAELRKKHS